MSVGQIMGGLVKGKVDPNVEHAHVSSLVEIIENVHKEYLTTANYIRPSMIGGCVRANFFHLLGKSAGPKRINAKLRRILDNGTAVHSVVQKYFSDSQDFFFAKEVPASKYVGDVLVKGTCDGVLIRRSDKFCLGIEIKTINHLDWSKLNSAKPAHIQQALLYAYLLNLRYISILYWDKDKQGLKEYCVQCTQENMKHILSKIGYISATRACGEIPLFKREECEPYFCQYYRHCPEVGMI